MKKTIDIQIIDYNQKLYTIILSGDNCAKNTIEGKASLFKMFNIIYQDPNLILTDTLTPDDMEIKHDGDKWVIKARVTRYEQTPEGRGVKVS